MKGIFKQSIVWVNIKICESYVSIIISLVVKAPAVISAVSCSKRRTYFFFPFFIVAVRRLLPFQPENHGTRPVLFGP